ncbi:MAG: 2Fe-2S iron-sulfur cluster binding domain-containing protein [Rhodoferax sp.]|uniref:2Fe-2S iron-sulfur cluster-binding protein n=1 Tax=Rhodoferax sp. TaxID=50421 RepID=UPI001B5ACF1A|nr:2Fe-2S iron-sulfur cluster-binding protein [Rhodoferax sp.]MBP9905818.1 2Fe-2S iron-sulfur cluster binding domain-containing protein [Rhodoferax sp.]
MTSLQLFLWIVGAILLQLAIYLGIVFSRHWLNYQTLRLSVERGELPTALAPDPLESENLPAAWSGLRDFKVIRKVVEDEAQDICSFYLAPQDAQPLPHFWPGQFLTFRLAIATADGDAERLTRCYSLSDAPRQDAYRVSIKRVPAQNSHAPGRSSNFFHDQVQVGSVLQLRAPAGHFHIDAGHGPVVLIAGGIGITPMLSMLNWCLPAQPGREVWLFYGARTRHELMAHGHLKALADQHPNFHLHICLSQAATGDVARQDDQHPGRVDVALLRRLLPLKPYHYYLCGPAQMLETMVPALEDWGVPDAHIHFEAFGPASVRRKNAGTSAMEDEPGSATGQVVTVTLARSGKQFAWDAAAGNLLDWAESHGIAVDSGCRSGSCGSCQTRIAAGQVRYRQKPDFDPEPGSCLMCVCQPKTSVTLEL